MGYLRLGSGNTASLLAGKNTKTHKKLMSLFISEEQPYYNALASPIDALRTGAILEDRYFLTLSDEWYSQYRVESEEMNVFVAHLDFAKIEKGKVVDFEELKTCELDSYFKILALKDKPTELLNYVKKYYKDNYNQIQQQLFCTGLNSAWLVYLGVDSYDDEVNKKRDVKEHELTRVRIQRDESVISKIKERGQIFQKIRDYYNN